MRSTILDAVSLDKETTLILKTQLNSIFPISQFCLFDSSFALNLFNLKYSNGSLIRKALYSILTNIEFNLPNKILILYKSLSLLNLMVFLRSGKYHSLPSRILNLSFIQNSPSCSKYTSFEYMNRNLFYREITSFISIFLPLLNLSSIKHKIYRFFNPSIQSLDPSCCAICFSVNRDLDLVLPFKTSCGHDYCYTCIKTAMMNDDDDKYQCLRCGQVVKSIQRVV